MIWNVQNGRGRKKKNLSSTRVHTCLLDHLCCHINIVHKLLLYKLFLNCFFLLHFQIILHCILDCHWQLFMKQEIASHSPAPASVLKAKAKQGWFYEWNNYSLILSLLATFLPLLALITMKHFATTYQAVNTADLGKVGCALPQQRTSGQLPKEANEFSSSTVWEGWGWF